MIQTGSQRHSFWHWPAKAAIEAANSITAKILLHAPIPFGVLNAGSQVNRFHRIYGDSNATKGTD